MSIDWPGMFHVGLPLVLEKIIRPIIVYAFLIVGLRLAGKRELAQLNAFDLIVLLTLSNTLQNAIIGNENTITGGIIGATTLLVLNHTLVKFLHRHPRIDALVEGRRDFLIKDGKLMKDHLNRELMTRAELIAAAHKQGIDSLAEVHTAVIEPTGTITFSTRSPTPDTTRHTELLAAIKVLRDEVASLRGGTSGL